MVLAPMVLKINLTNSLKKKWLRMNCMLLFNYFVESIKILTHVIIPRIICENNFLIEVLRQLEKLDAVP